MAAWDGIGISLNLARRTLPISSGRFGSLATPGGRVSSFGRERACVTTSADSVVFSAELLLVLASSRRDGRTCAHSILCAQVATRTAKKAAAAVTAAMPAQQQQQAESMAAVASTASPPATPPRPGFLYTAAAPAPVVPVPYVWGSWPPGATAAGYEHRGSPPPLCLQPCAWYYPVVQADPRGSPSSAYAQPQPPQQAAAFQDPRGAAAEPVGSGGSPAGGGATAEEDTDDDPCSLTLGLDVVDKRMSAPVSIFPAGPGGGGGGALSDRDKAATAAEARKRRKELTKLKHMHAATARPGGEQW